MNLAVVNSCTRECVALDVGPSFGDQNACRTAASSSRTSCFRSARMPSTLPIEGYQLGHGAIHLAVNRLIPLGAVNFSAKVGPHSPHRSLRGLPRMVWLESLGETSHASRHVRPERFLSASGAPSGSSKRQLLSLKGKPLLAGD